MSPQEHAAALLGRLRSHGAPALTVHDAIVPDGASAPYVLVRFSFRALRASERPDASNLVLESLPFQVDATTYSVAASGLHTDLVARAARAIAGRVFAALLDWTPDVTGRSCTPVRHIDSFEAPADEATGTAYLELGDIWRFTSHPA